MRIAFKITTPTNFLTSSTANGITITSMQFDVGDANSGVGVATGADPVNLSSAIGSYTATGSIVYGASNTVFTLSPVVTLTNGRLSFAAVEGVNVGTSAISGIAIHEFDFAITYANAAPVPEGSTWALMLAGLGAIGGVARRKSRG